MDQTRDCNRSLENNTNRQLGGKIGQEEVGRIDLGLALTFIIGLGYLYVSYSNGTFEFVCNLLVVLRLNSLLQFFFLIFSLHLRPILVHETFGLKM